MVVAEGRQAGDVLVQDLEAFLAELLQHGVCVDRVPEHDGVHDEAERTELIFLPLPIALLQFAAFAVEDDPRQHVPGFAAIEPHEDTAAVGLVVEVVEQVHCLDHAPEISKGTRDLGRAVVGLQHPHQAGSLLQRDRKQHKAVAHGAGAARQSR